MKQIPLSRGRFALVDDEDYEWLNQWKWSFLNTRTGYAVRHDYSVSKTEMLYMHRVIMKTPKYLQVDHKNHNSLDNQRTNLRNCTQEQNRQNMRKYSNAFMSKFKGVFYSPKSIKKWEVELGFQKKRIHIGNFKEEHHAALAYDLWATHLYGEFAQTNFPVVASH